MKTDLERCVYKYNPRDTRRVKRLEAQIEARRQSVFQARLTALTIVVIVSLIAIGVRL